MRRIKPEILFLSPAIAIIAAVTVYPLCYVLWLSLQRRLLIFDVSRFIGLENYAFLLQDERFWRSLSNTLYFSAVSVLIELLLGLGIAVILNTPFRGNGVFRAAVLLPWAIPTVVSARIWEWIFNSDYGVLNHVLGAQINWLGSPIWALNSAVLVDVWKTTPFVALLLLAALQEVPADLYKAAYVDGASRWTTFCRVTLPLIKPVILITLVFRTLDAIRVFDSVYVLTGGGPAGTTETLSIYAYRLLFQTLQFGYGSTIAVSVFFLAGLLTLGFIRLLKVD